MARIASIKGSVINELAEDIAKSEANGDITPKQIEARLTGEDRATLAAGVLEAQWYDVQFYRRCSELLRDTLGDGDDAYLVKRGFNKGTKLIKAGLYQQMEYATRTQVQKALSAEERFTAYGRDLRLFVTLSGSILNFSTWSVAPDPDHADRYAIVVDDAAEFPDALAWASEGLMEAMSASHDMAKVWRHQRMSDDQIMFRMSRSL